MSNKMKISDVYEVKRLRLREHREKSGCVIVEGLPEVQRALKARVPVTKLFLCPEILECGVKQFSKYNPVIITKEEFKKIAFGHRLKGILAICKPKRLTLDKLSLGKNSFIVVMESVEKPGNLGTVIRSCDGAGVDAVIYCDQKTDIFNQHVVRSSIGSLFHVPIVEATVQEAVAFLRKNRIKIYAASAKGKQNYFDCNFNSPSAIILGNEHSGVSKEFINQADEVIRIPMQGQSSSLNVAVSASVLIFEVDRQRRK